MISGIERLTFTGNAQTATFDAGQLPTSLLITGVAGTQNIVVNNASSFFAAGWTFSNWTAGTDTITINGSSGEDVISGSTQNDILNGGANADVMDGRDGSDTYVFATGDVVAGEIINDTGTAGTDTLRLNSSVDFSSATTISGIEVLAFTGDAQTATFDAGQLPTNLFITGASGTQNLVINDATFFFSASAWTFSGWAAGTDTVAINGTSGDDVIGGTMQADTITGGAGHDIFIEGFPGPSFGQDTITDFNPSEDVILFDPSLFANYMAVFDATAQVGSDTVITYDANNSLTLTNVTASSLSETNFQSPYA
jgi:Ca2+-binding RTX toxin-like protein